MESKCHECSKRPFLYSPHSSKYNPSRHPPHRMSHQRQLPCHHRPNFNSVVIQNIAVGLFPLTAILNHSCRPNATYVTDTVSSSSDVDTSPPTFGTMLVRTLVSCPG
ncbi:hypothetical protein BC829DRAFT_157663 [Chytridium lagenaria]|nr:hypothetical protein BC829DRAFT_157663 [Chytridium lagenaria]